MIVESDTALQCVEKLSAYLRVKIDGLEAEKTKIMARCSDPGSQDSRRLREISGALYALVDLRDNLVVNTQAMVAVRRVIEKQNQVIVQDDDATVADAFLGTRLKAEKIGLELHTTRLDGVCHFILEEKSGGENMQIELRHECHSLEEVDDLIKNWKDYTTGVKQAGTNR